MRALVLESKEAGLIYKDSYKIQEPSDNKFVEVEVLAAALNKRDYWILKGKYPGIRYPVILGSDAVVRFASKRYLINPNIKWGENQEVQSNEYQIIGTPSNGTFADKLLISKDKLIPCPDHLTNEEAASLPLAGLTAYRALFKKCQLKKDENVMISGIGGGVATTAFQFAKAISARVFVSSSSEIKRKKALEIGAEAAVDYNMESYGRNLYKNYGGMQVVIDGAGGSGFKELIEAASPSARIALYGGTAGTAKFSPQRLFWRQIKLFGTTMGSDQDFKEMVEFVHSQRIVPIVSSTYDLKEGIRAFKEMERQDQMGKIVLKIQD